MPGVQVFHGLVGLKTHCKLSLLVRRDPDGVSLATRTSGTGNYNAHHCANLHRLFVYGEESVHQQLPVGHPVSSFLRPLRLILKPAAPWSLCHLGEKNDCPY